MPSITINQMDGSSHTFEVKDKDTIKNVIKKIEKINPSQVAADFELFVAGEEDPLTPEHKISELSEISSDGNVVLFMLPKPLQQKQVPWDDHATQFRIIECFLNDPDKFDWDQVSFMVPGEQLYALHGQQPSGNKELFLSPNENLQEGNGLQIFNVGDFPFGQDEIPVMPVYVKDTHDNADAYSINLTRLQIQTIITLRNIQLQLNHIHVDNLKKFARSIITEKLKNPKLETYFPTETCIKLRRFFQLKLLYGPIDQSWDARQVKLSSSTIGLLEIIADPTDCIYTQNLCDELTDNLDHKIAMRITIKIIESFIHASPDNREKICQLFLQKRENRKQNRLSNLFPSAPASNAKLIADSLAKMAAEESLSKNKNSLSICLQQMFSPLTNPNRYLLLCHGAGTMPRDMATANCCANAQDLLNYIIATKNPTLIKIAMTAACKAKLPLPSDTVDTLHQILNKLLSRTPAQQDRVMKLIGIMSQLENENGECPLDLFNCPGGSPRGNLENILELNIKSQSEGETAPDEIILLSRALTAAPPEPQASQPEI